MQQRQIQEDVVTRTLGVRIQTKDVVPMAAMVPMGIDFCASARSPERLEPAMIPVHDGKKIPSSMMNDVAMSATMSPFSLSPGSLSPIRSFGSLYALKVFSGKHETIL